MKSGLIHFVKRCIPPIFMDVLRSLTKGYRKPSQVHLFRGVFPSLEEARAQEATGYDTSSSFDLTRGRHEERLAAIEGGAVESVETVRGLFMPVILSMNGGAKERVRVLDMGGSFGTLYLDLRMYSTFHDVEITVFDMPETVAEGERMYADVESDRLNFVSSLSDVGDVDIIHYGSSIQYFDDISGIVTELVKHHPKYIMLVDSFFSPQETIYTHQGNCPGRLIPYVMHGFRETVDAMKKEGYGLLLHFEHDMTMYDYSYLPERYRSNNSSTLIFSATSNERHHG